MKHFNWTRLLLVMSLVAIFATLAACGPSGKVESDKEKLVIKFYKEVVGGGYKIAATDTLKGWVDAKKPMLIIDTMPLEASYNKNHVPGAKQFLFPVGPMAKMDDAAKAKFVELLGPDKDRMLVFYCGFPKCDRSHNGAAWAVKLGYSNVYRHPGGIMAWIEQGLPVGKAK